MQPDREAALLAEVARLDARVQWLEDALGMSSTAPLGFGLTASEGRVLGILEKRELVTKAAAMAALYHTRSDDEVEIKIVDVFICKLRKKLKPHGIEIKTEWGSGYWLSADTKKRIAELRAAQVGRVEQAA